MERNFKKSQNFLKTFHYELLHMGSKKCGFSTTSALFSNFVFIRIHINNFIRAKPMSLQFTRKFEETTIIKED